MAENISILGSTGSIGTQTLDVVRLHNKLSVKALSAYGNIDLLEKQIREFKPELAAVVEESKYNDLKTRVADTSTKVVCGFDGLCECAAVNSTDTVVTSVVGMIGLVPTLIAIEAGKNIALANKETLVAGGELVMKAAKEKGINIYPVDSEHSAIFQCLQASGRKENLKKIILTASGGPFFGKSKEFLENVSVEMALNHPNWSMGKKVTIDSATMMNKGLEFIEAKWLFDMEPENIDILVHKQSIVHSLIEFKDNSVLAQLGVPDMRIPIQYALTYPDREISPVEELDLAEICNLSFYKPDYEVFECIDICRQAIKMGGLHPAAANSANEQAVKLFLDRRIKFNDIPVLVRKAMENAKDKKDITVDDIFETQKLSEQFVLDNI